MNVLRWLGVIAIAYLVGKLFSKMKLPAILGWLIAGMVYGPYAVDFMPQALLDAQWYQIIIHIAECFVGVMIGVELVWHKLKRSGKQIIVTTLTQSLGTFVFVSLVFGIVFYFMDIPLYLAVIFGGIALATAPAPALSIVEEFHTDGPVTKTLIPMAALDDMVGVVVFFTVISVVASYLSGGGMPAYMIPVIVLLPLAIGAVLGVPAAFLLKKDRGKAVTLLIMCAGLVAVSAVGMVFNSFVMPSPVLNFMLMGMAYSAVIANVVSEERLAQISAAFHPLLSVAILLAIVNLGAPLDYHSIMGAGVFTAIYILSRAFGKYFGAYFGSSITKAPPTVKKYLGLTLLPHSGVSLVFTGIAVSSLQSAAPECAGIIQGTIAAAAVLNEIIAVIVAKKGFEWAGECKDKNETPAQEAKTA